VGEDNDLVILMAGFSQRRGDDAHALVDGHQQVVGTEDSLQRALQPRRCGSRAVGGDTCEEAIDFGVSRRASGTRRRPARTPAQRKKRTMPMRQGGLDPRLR
jgi:hypothetical protein